MGYNPDHHRQSIRLRDYDYASSGIYFVTICIQHDQDILSLVYEEQTEPTELGKIIQATWDSLSSRFNMQTDAFVIMPDHIHGIIVINPPPATNPIAMQNVDPFGSHRGAASSTPTQNTKNTIITPTNNPPTTTNQLPVGALLAAPNGTTNPNPIKHASLSQIVRAFKSISAIAINTLLGRTAMAFWQRNYHERIVRNGPELQQIRAYIANNPTRWLAKAAALAQMDSQSGVMM
jgi:putative transposase